MPQNFGLGRGLASLIPQKNNYSKALDKPINKPDKKFNYFGSKPLVTENSGNNLTGSDSKNINEIDINLIIPNPHQPRQHFDQEKLKELATSIKEYGIIQPLIVTKNGNQYEIIAGERRFEGAKLAGLTKIPVIIREASQQQKLELAVIENIQRHDLNPIEEAKSYYKLAEEFNLSQEEIAKKVGKSRSAIANKTRLLNLPVEIQKALISEKITEGHAKAILAIDNPEKQRALFELILKNSLTVRQTEDKTKEISVRTHKRIITQDPRIKDLEEKLIGSLGTKVKLTKSGQGGKIIIDYYSQEELNNLISKLCP